MNNYWKWWRIDITDIVECFRKKSYIKRYSCVVSSCRCIYVMHFSSYYIIQTGFVFSFDKRAIFWYPVALLSASYLPCNIWMLAFSQARYCVCITFGILAISTKSYWLLVIFQRTRWIHQSIIEIICHMMLNEIECFTMHFGMYKIICIVCIYHCIQSIGAYKICSVQICRLIIVIHC